MKRSLVSIEKGSVIPLIKNKIWFIANGLIRVWSKSTYRDSSIIGFVGPNELFGEPLTSMDYVKAVAMTNCQFLCINKDDIYNSNELLVTMNECLSKRYRQSELMLSILAMKISTKKLICFLEMIVLDYGKAIEGGLLIPFKLKHEEIGGALCMTRVTVTRAISYLKSQGLIIKDSKGNFVIKNSQEVHQLI